MNAALQFKQTTMSDPIGNVMDQPLREAMEYVNQDVTTEIETTVISSHIFVKNAI